VVPLIIVVNRDHLDAYSMVIDLPALLLLLLRLIAGQGSGLRFVRSIVLHPLPCVQLYSRAHPPR